MRLTCLDLSVFVCVCVWWCGLHFRYENAFLISQVGLRPEKYFWIGLSNTERIDRFQWTNKKTVKFTHFNVGMPGMYIIIYLFICHTLNIVVTFNLHKVMQSWLYLPTWNVARNQGCVAMRTGTSAGLWDVIKCDSIEKYICKKIAEGVTTTKEPPVTQPLSCPSKWIKKGTSSCIQVKPLHTQRVTALTCSVNS